MAAVSLFVALSMGGAWAAGVAKNSVRSKQIKDGAVSAKDVRDASLTGADVRDDSLTGADVDESTLELVAAPPAGGDGGGGDAGGDAPAAPPAATEATPTGPAGGALTGTYPNPGLAPQSVGAAEIEEDIVGSNHIETGGVGSGDIGAQAVQSSEVRDGSLRGDDVGRASGTVPSVDIPALPAGGCTNVQLNLGAVGDTRFDAFAITMESGFPDFIGVTPIASGVQGRLGLGVCNHDSITVNPGPGDVHWVAFDV